MKIPFEQVVVEHGRTVLRVCRAVLGVHEADDAWSETFLAALRAYPRLPDDANVQAWLVTIAHRKALDVIRSASRRAITVESLPEGVSERGNPGTEDDELWSRLAALTPRQRQAVAYHHVAGLAFTEVAVLLECSPAAARKASSDGIATLRRAYSAPEPKETR